MKKFFARIIAIIAIILIIIAIIWSGGLLSPALAATLSSYFAMIGLTIVTAGQLALIGVVLLGLAMVVDYDETVDVISSAFEKVEGVASTVAEAASDILSSVANATGVGTLLKYLGIGVAGFIGYKLIGGSNEKDDQSIIF